MRVERDAYCWCERVESGSSRTETDSGEEILNGEGWIQIWRHVLFYANIFSCIICKLDENLNVTMFGLISTCSYCYYIYIVQTNIIICEPSISKPSGCRVVHKIFAVRRKIAPKCSFDVVVVSRIYCRVPEYENRWNWWRLLRLQTSGASSSGPSCKHQKQKAIYESGTMP